MNDGTHKNDASAIWDTSVVGTNLAEPTGVHTNSLRLFLPSARLMQDLAAISRDLLGIDPAQTKHGILLRVDRYQGEWLRWEPSYSLSMFMSDVFFRIDDGEISIYPGDWVCH